MNKPLVTISCITFNQEKYIGDAIEGFLTQQTNFEYEIYIHDDASTDGTRHIIEKYIEKYPEKIHGILETENQFSKGINPNFINYHQSSGKYIALCEGDDYWIDPLKLQKQVDYLENHEDCTFCFTNGYIQNAADNNDKRIFIPYNHSRYDKHYYKKGNRKYDLSNFYQLSFIPTASFMFPRSNLNKLPRSFFNKCQAGDLKMRLFYTAMGYAYFIDDPTCVYRENVSNSSMSRWASEDRNKNMERDAEIIKMIDDVDNFSNLRYSHQLNKIKDLHIENYLRYFKVKEFFRDTKARSYFNQMLLLDRARLVVKRMMKGK